MKALNAKQEALEEDLTKVMKERDIAVKITKTISNNLKEEELKSQSLEAAVSQTS